MPAARWPWPPWRGPAAAGRHPGQPGQARKPRCRSSPRPTGVLITRGSGAYRAAQREIARVSGVRPLAILRARSVSDVREAVKWCARYDVKIAARSGRHSYAGYSTVQGGLIVDLARLNGIRVAPGGEPCRWARATA